MNRNELERYIACTYSAGAEHLWARYPNYAVFRHSGNRKWFAAVMDVPRKSLGLPGDGTLDILNVKCDPLLIGSLREEPGIYPAYHMSRANWLSAALDGSVSRETVQALLDMSFRLTAPKARKRKPPSLQEPPEESQGELAAMPNIGKEMARKLAAAGFTSSEQLMEAGAKQAFFKLKTLYPNVCLVHLYALEGAVRGLDMQDLSQETKQDLKKFSDALKGKGGIRP